MPKRARFSENAATKLSRGVNLAALSPELKELWHQRVLAYMRRIAGLDRKEAEKIATISIEADLETDENLKNLVV